MLLNSDSEFQEMETEDNPRRITFGPVNISVLKQLSRPLEIMKN